MLPNWCSFENVKWMLTTLLIPLTLLYLNQQYQDGQNERQATEARVRLYTEILTKSAEADANLRKGVFDRVLETYLKEAKTIDVKLSALEVLTLNSGDSADLSPMFRQLFHEIQRPAQKVKRAILLERLERLSHQVKDRQIELLATIGAAGFANFSIEDLSAEAGKPPKTGPIIDDDFSFDDPEASNPGERKQIRHFRVYPLEYDQKG